jgi:predicted DNA-binding transcriptional regulator AlpA
MFPPVEAQMTPSPETDQLLTTRDVAKLTRYSVESIKRFRRLGVLPAPVRIGERSIRYRLIDIRAWIEQQAAK